MPGITSIDGAQAPATCDRDRLICGFQVIVPPVQQMKTRICCPFKGSPDIDTKLLHDVHGKVKERGNNTK